MLDAKLDNIITLQKQTVQAQSVRNNILKHFTAPLQNFKEQ